jgi:hypothetical protein
MIDTFTLKIQALQTTISE